MTYIIHKDSFFVTHIPNGEFNPNIEKYEEKYNNHFFIDDISHLPEEKRYWKVEGDNVVSMTEQEKKAIRDNDPVEYAICKYMDDEYVFNCYEAPKDTPYNILGLHKQDTIVFGQLTRTDYYGEYDEETGVFSDPVVRENRDFRFKGGNYYRRDMTITWIKEDGTDGDSKFSKKYYSPEKANIAGQKRRNNVINAIKPKIIGMIAQTEQVDVPTAMNMGGQFFMQYKTEIDLYVDGINEPLNIALGNDASFSRLDNVIDGSTIRDIVLYDISYVFQDGRTID